MIQNRPDAPLPTLRVGSRSGAPTGAPREWQGALPEHFESDGRKTMNIEYVRALRRCLAFYWACVGMYALCTILVAVLSWSIT